MSSLGAAVAPTLASGPLASTTALFNLDRLASSAALVNLRTALFTLRSFTAFFSARCSCLFLIFFLILPYDPMGSILRGLPQGKSAVAPPARELAPDSRRPITGLL